jgi:lipopolysaccharide export system protein LptA
LRKSFLLTPLILLVLTYFSYAQVNGDVVITGDTLSYSEDGTSVEASGSVEVVSPDVLITADHVIYFVDNKQVLADKGFAMQIKNGARLSGDSLDYNFKTRSGLTKNVKIAYKYAVLSGDWAHIDDEKIEMKNSSFNMCGLEPPHYHVSSSTTTLYPEEGWVLGYWGYLWLGSFPLVPVPVYLYDLSAYGVGQKSDASGVMSVPQMGSNDEDGFYVRYKVPWIANRKLNGRLVFLNTAKGGFGGGVEGDYLADDYNDTNFRVYYDPRYNTFGGITHSYNFGPETGQNTDSLYQFFRIKRDLMFTLTTNVSYNEEINFQRVSMLPDVTLKLNDVPAFFKYFNVGGSISYGYITEETSGTGDSTGNIQTRGYFNVPTDYGRIYAGFEQNQSWYGLTSFWSRLKQNLRFSHDFGGGVDGYVGHMHYIDFVGGSPFQYEMYLTTPSDEFYTGLGYNFGPHRLSVDYSYYVPDWEPKELIYTLTLGFHCYSVEIKYNTAMQQLTLGVNLITR